MKLKGERRPSRTDVSTFVLTVASSFFFLFFSVSCYLLLHYGSSRFFLRFLIALRDVTKYNKLFLDREWRLRTSKIAKIAKIAKISKSYLRNWYSARLMLIVKILTIICCNQRVFWGGCESKKYFEVRSIDFKACSSINTRNIYMKLPIFFPFTILSCHVIFRIKNTRYFAQTLEHFLLDHKISLRSIL